MRKGQARLGLLTSLTQLSAGAIVCGATPIVVEKWFTAKQLATSPVPFLVVLGGPLILSFVIASLGQKSIRFLLAWISLGSAAFLVGEILAIYFRHGNDSLWRIELVLMAGLGFVALAVGAGLACAWSRAYGWA